MADIRIGVDLGGTKIEAIAINNEGAVLTKHRVSTPKGDYLGTLAAIKTLVETLEHRVRSTGSIGVGMPGSFSPTTGLVRNANSTWLNGQAFDKDLQSLLGRDIRFANDANCLAVSEAIDGAAKGKHLVFAIILGTGVGGGLAINGRVHQGLNGVAGEWGHNPVPWMSTAELPGPDCYCGKQGCVETLLSGPGLSNDHYRATGQQLSGQAIVQAKLSGNQDAINTFTRYQDRLAKAIASVVNVLDPEIFVLGGGLSNVEALYQGLQDRVAMHTFGGEFTTPILPAKHGDSSGVRGAAWLW